MSLQFKWKCSGCDCPLRVNFTKVDGRPSIATRIMVGAVSAAISIHDKPNHEIHSFASFCPGCADIGLVEQFMEMRQQLIPATAPGAMKAEGRNGPPPATVPCRGCAAMFVHTGHRDDHEMRAHPGLKPGQPFSQNYLLL